MADKPKPEPGSKPASPLKNAYLIFYNSASAVAWSVVLGRTIAALYLRGPAAVYAAVGEWTKWTQTVAVLEILHSLLGIVRAPVSTTTMQVLSRLLLVWPVVNTWPFLALSPFYTSMLVAWSVTEVARYSYFALSLAGALPALLTWARYSMFYVLYPMGITSECMLVFGATVPAAERSSLAPWALYIVLAIYVPGSYVLFTHMMKQRSKILRSPKTKDDKAQ
ncbi:protein tyrosine phosphatase [Metarhizium album ARSEF 1941]|uniref:Very-long-chain (3R)-3-hydroxyacyl-CoA dehydratase n=1 Tax=Metarhizium album (strain ARSEF 1941) TaxID=1081103 RepID=A0A0B2WZL4_METAS|nr:protein tyrosine phosphatase [Metarhizium album ARSEF 1941]KHN99493.1 protein tyrosine phosphatase [Metarhizium album ARSEF 1941]